MTHVKFLDYNLNDNNFATPSKNGMLFASCLDTCSYPFFELAKEHTKFGNNKAILFFTDPFYWREILSRKKDNHENIECILIKIPKCKSDLHTAAFNTWAYINSNYSDNTEIFRHNCYSAYKVDRNIMHSRAAKHNTSVLVGFVASHMFSILQKLDRSIISKSFFIAEGTTFVDIVLANVAMINNITMFIPCQSRIPSGFTLVHKDLYESQFHCQTVKCSESTLSESSFTYAQNVTYSHYEEPLANLIQRLDTNAIFKRIYKLLSRYNFLRTSEEDHFNRSSYLDIIDRYIGQLSKYIIKLIYHRRQFKNKYKNINPSDHLVFFLHIYPERSVDIMSKMPVGYTQWSFIEELILIKPDHLWLTLVLHPAETRFSVFIKCLLFVMKKKVRVTIESPKLDPFVHTASFSGTIILERSLALLPTYHSTDCYVSEGQKANLFITPVDLIALIENNGINYGNPSFKTPNQFPPGSTLDGILFSAKSDAKIFSSFISLIYNSSS